MEIGRENKYKVFIFIHIGCSTEVWLSLLLIFLLLLAAGALAISKSLQCAEASRIEVVVPKWESIYSYCFMDVYGGYIMAILKYIIMYR